jgi:8-oxo-dGTP diphosphatase
VSDEPPILVSAAVLERDGRVLLTRRMKGAHLEGYWEFPGGKVEPGEDPKDALVREVREECAIDIEVLDILDVTFHRYPEKDVLLLFYDCRFAEGGAREVQHLGVADHVFVLPEDLPRYPLPPPDDAVVAKIRGRGPTA